MNACPEQQVLAAYARGALSDLDALRVERHVDACAVCRRAMDTASSINTDRAASAWTVPDYDRIALCGEGSYGAVWVVRDRVGVFRALKMIDLQRLEQDDIRCHERPALEAYCRKVARHPNLITIFHVGEIESGLYYTMELADDQTLRAPVPDEFPENYKPLTLDTFISAGHLSVDAGIELGLRMLRGLARLHALGLIHRDVKPSNIVFVNRQPKLADIGVLTGEGEKRRIIGTPKYMPPDRIMNKTADTFAVARVLHEMIMGKGHGSFPELPADDRWLGAKWHWERVAKLVRKAASANAAERYPDAMTMLHDLEDCALGESTSLFDELVEKPPAPQAPVTSKVLIPLAFALVYRIPWIVGLILVIYLMETFCAR